MIEAPPDDQFLALQEPTELLPAVAMHVAIGVDEDPAGASLHHSSLRLIPTNGGMAAPCSPHFGDPGRSDALRPGDDSAVDGFRLRQIEIATQDLPLRVRLRNNGQHTFEH